MKPQNTFFKWIIIPDIFSLLLSSVLVSPSVSAQDEQPPTPTTIPTEEEPVVDDFPEPTPQPTFEEGEGGEVEGFQSFSVQTVTTPSPADPDCSDGRCVFIVSSSSDDAGVHPNCTYSTTANEIYMGQCTNGQPITSGFRFPNINIPQGTVIQNAYLEFTLDGPYTDELNVVFYGQDSANALPFTNTSRPSNRPIISTHPVYWHIPATEPWSLDQIGMPPSPPSITPIIQEIINRPDWVQGNAIAIILRNVGPSSGTFKHRRVIAYDRFTSTYGATNAARLVIELEYDCSDYESTLSPIAQAVLVEVGEQQFCGNNYEDLIILPPGRDAFEQFRVLASEAKYEVDFTTMIWEEGEAGDIILEGIEELYDKVQNPVDHGLPSDYYSEGVYVRILVGLKTYLSPKDQRAIIMQALDVGPNDDKWTLEVAAYRNGFGTGIHSHVKTMIVDGKTIIVSGYNVQNNYLNDQRRDMGVQVSGPIALNALQIFDNLWMNADICEQNNLTSCISESTVTDISHHEATLQTIVKGDDIIFSLFRDDINKDSDDAIVAAINAGNDNIKIIQDRFQTGYIFVPPYAEAVLNAVTNQVYVNVLVSGRGESSLISSNGLCNLKRKILSNDPSKAQYFEGRFSIFEVHTKSLSVDDSFIIVGSQNFDRSAWEDDNSLLTFGDLAEYNLGIDSTLGTNTAASEYRDNFLSEWDDSNTDPVDCGNSSVSLQSRIDEAEVGTILVIPVGVYTESVTINKPLTLIGANPNQTIIQPIGNEPAFRITSSDVVIANMKITGGNGYGIELIDSSPSSLENLQIYRVVFEENEQGGVFVQGLIPGSPMNYTIENSTFIGGGSGITINMLETQAEKSFIRNNIFYNQLRFPIEILSENDSHVEYSFNLFDNCDLGNCTIYWRDTEGGVLSPLSSQHDNLFDLDPRFMSDSDGAYQLSATSPAIDAGDPAMLHQLYFDGNNDEIVRIDIGAFEYAPFTNLPPVVTAGDDQSVEIGNPVNITATYTDEDNIEDHTAKISWGDGVVEDVSAIATAPNQGEVVGTHTYTEIGAYTVEICVIDLYGGVGCDTLQVNVTQSPTQFTFTGFFPPVDNQPIINTVNAGRSIPIKFSLNGYQGLDIFAVGYPASVTVACGTSAEDAIEQTVTAGGSSLSYDATTDQYTYVWKTDKAWANTCRTLVLKLSDGSTYRANFKFKK